MPRKDYQPDALMALRFIQRTIAERGFPPTRREIGEACGWVSPSSGQTLIRFMESEGLIRTTPGIPRSVQITESGMVALTLPV